MGTILLEETADTPTLALALGALGWDGVFAAVGRGVEEAGRTIPDDAGAVLFADWGDADFGRAGTAPVPGRKAPAAGVLVFPACIWARKVFALTEDVDFAAAAASRRRFFARISALSKPSVFSLSTPP